MHNPWAMWVMLGWKTIETREHDRFKTLVGHDIAIHATMKWDHAAYESALQSGGLSYGQLKRSEEFKSIRGVILGTTTVALFRRLTEEDSGDALIECRTRRYGLFLRNPILLKTPIPCKGHQGIFRVELP